MSMIPYDLIAVADRFPLSIEDFRRLKDYPRSQLRVAHFLLADEETRKKLFYQPSSKWRMEDTVFLIKAVRDQVSEIQLSSLPAFILTMVSHSPLSKKKSSKRSFDTALALRWRWIQKIRVHCPLAIHLL
jgi:hypothetical protein